MNTGMYRFKLDSINSPGLPSQPIYTTRQEAIDAAVDARQDAGDPRPSGAIIEQVRTPLLGDFLRTEDVVSIIREGMASRIGNDDALTNEVIAVLDGKIPDMASVLNELDVRIDGYHIIHAERIKFSGKA